MNGSPVRLRGITAALLAVLALMGGCAPRSPRGAQPAGPVGVTSDLSPAQERRTEAVALFATGVAAEMQHGMEAALDYYRRAYALDPQNLELGVGIAKALIGRREFGEARGILQQATTANPKAAEPLFWLAVADKTEEQVPAASEALRRAIKLDPQHINAIHLLSEIYLQQTNTTDLVKLLDQSFRQKSTDSAYWVRVGDLYVLALKQVPVLTNQVDGARALLSYQKAQALEPAEADVAVRLAGAYEANGDVVKAAAILAEQITRQPDDIPMRLRLLTLYLRAEDRAHAVAQLEEVIKREPLRPEFYNQLAALYEDLKQEDKALDNYQQSLTINPNQIEVYLQIAMLQMGRKNFPAARQALDRWKEKAPTDFRIPYLTGMMLADEKKYKEAVASYQDAEALAAEAPREVKLNAQFYFAYGAACERSGDLEKAATLFQKVIDLDPADHMAHNYLGYMWADKGTHLDEAYRLIKIANERQPDNGAYLDSLGWVLYRLGRAEEALVQLQRAAGFEQDDPTVFEHLAEVMEKLGRRDEAIGYLQQALKAYPDNKDLAEKLQKLSGK